LIWNKYVRSAAGADYFSRRSTIYIDTQPSIHAITRRAHQWPKELKLFARHVI
jgi:hypothetical protein